MKTTKSFDTAVLACALTWLLVIGSAKATRFDDGSFFALGRVPLAGEGDDGSLMATSSWLSSLLPSTRVPFDPSSRHQASWKRTARGGSLVVSPGLPQSTATASPESPRGSSETSATTAADGTLDQQQRPQPFLPRALQQIGKARRTVESLLSIEESTATTSDPPMEQVLGINEPGAITKPIFGRNVWESLTGREFVDDSTLVEELVTTGRQVVSQQPADGNPWVHWKAVDTEGDLLEADNEERIHTWTGTSRLQGYGSQAPWIKTQAIVPLAPTLLAQLLMDSKQRVPSYHDTTSSAERQDLWVDLKATGTVTKVCRHVVTTQSLSSSQPTEYTSVVHTRPVPATHETSIDNVNPSWIMVNRAVGGTAFAAVSDNDDDTDTKNCQSSQVLLGVNLLETVPGRPNATRMTTLSHVHYESGNKHPGLQPAIQFVQDVRQAVQYQK